MTNKIILAIILLLNCNIGFSQSVKMISEETFNDSHVRSELSGNKLFVVNVASDEKLVIFIIDTKSDSIIARKDIFEDFAIPYELKISEDNVYVLMSRYFNNNTNTILYKFDTSLSVIWRK